MNFGFTEEQLELQEMVREFVAKEISKKAGQKGFYLEKDREYRTEADVFEDFTAEERAKLFGEPPATVWENIRNWDKYPEKKKVIMEGGIFGEAVIRSFAEGAMIRWKTELLNRLIPEVRADVVATKKLHDAGNGTAYDNVVWKKIQAVRNKLAKDSAKEISTFTEIKNAIEAGDYDAVSAKFLEMQKLKDELYALYHDYRQNIID